MTDKQVSSHRVSPGSLHPAINRLRESIGRVYIGNPSAIDRIICCLLARGHMLLEDVPGVGKTIIASALAKSVGCSLGRIQLTPDMLPADILGVSILDRTQGEFVFKPGPIFANIVIADEINRTTPRTQTALLQAMGEGRVSIDGQTHTLEAPFMVIATQNPYEFAGTYPLPENQLDRFLMRMRLGYPSDSAEKHILKTRPATTVLDTIEPILSREEIIELQQATDEVEIDPAILEYIVSFATATRNDDRLHLGLSPRGSLALAQAARASAFFHSRDYVVPEDVLSNILVVCAHRVIARTTAQGLELADTEQILTSIMQSLHSPV